VGLALGDTGSLLSELSAPVGNELELLLGRSEHWNASAWRWRLHSVLSLSDITWLRGEQFMETLLTEHRRRSVSKLGGSLGGLVGSSTRRSAGAALGADSGRLGLRQELGTRTEELGPGTRQKH
jgi:hypothetical protein